MRLIFIIAVLTFVGRSSCSAAAVRIVDAPETIIPGQTFSFDVVVPAMTALSAYQIDILLAGSTGSAGIDFQFGPAEAVAPADGYVFASTDFFAPAINNVSTAVQRLTLSDIDLVGRNTITGVNDQIARVSVLTSDSYDGSLQFSIDPATLILDGPQFTPTSVPEFASIQADTLNQPSITITAVPEPAAFTLLAGLTVCFRSVRKKKA